MILFVVKKILCERKLIEDATQQPNIEDQVRKIDPWPIQHSCHVICLRLHLITQPRHVYTHVLRH